MPNGDWEKRITILETQNENICTKVDRLRATVETIRDNHLVHIRRQIEDLRVEMIAQNARLAREFAGRDAELDKKLAVLAVKVGAITAIASVVLNQLILRLPW